MRRAAISTTATNARFSIVTTWASPGPAGDRTPLDERDDTGQPGAGPATDLAPGPARGEPGVRTPSTSARTDRLEAAAGRPAAGTRQSLPRRWRTRSSPRAGAGNRGQRVPELSGQGGEGGGQCGWPADDHQRGPGRCGLAAGPIGFAQPAAGPIPLHGGLELATHGEPGARRLVGLSPEHHERRPVDPSASLKERLELGAAGQPLASGEAARQ